MIGETISHYRILEKLGKGGMGVVYLAEDLHLGRRVAIKFLTADADQNYRARFLREARTVSSLTHPNIATVFGAGEVDGNPLMTIEFIEGMSLGERLEREGNMQEKVAWRAAREVAKGLAFAAVQGVVHRDIKPDNILCSNDSMAHGHRVTRSWARPFIFRLSKPPESQLMAAAIFLRSELCCMSASRASPPFPATACSRLDRKSCMSIRHRHRRSTEPFPRSSTALR